jgi:glycosyltransferase involved in cell wall biosynthesis
MTRVSIAAVIPAFNVARTIDRVLVEIPAEVGCVIVVDDGSGDDTADVVARRAASDSRVQLVRHDRNQGLGAAMVTGFRKALEAGAAIAVKIDGDGQMPPHLVPRLIEPLLAGDADYAKGNRFRDFVAIRQMPFLRRFGNLTLSFLAKAATGYWHCFDPANGFVAIRTDVLEQIPLGKIDTGYFFEISMLSQLYLLGAVVEEEPMPARYGDETSNLSIPRVVATFPGRLLYSLLRRLWLKNFVYDFGLQSLQLAAGLPLLLAGIVYGGYNWYWYATHSLAAPTGTVVLPTLLIILGFQLLLSAVALDVQSVPREPVNGGALV